MAIVLTSSLLLASSEQGSAETFPKNVRGYVLDSMGTPIPDASVTINIRWALGDTIRATYPTTAGPDGFYSESVFGADWDVGDRIEVIAQHESFFGTNSVTADVSGIQTVDVTIGIVIPEFGALLGTPLTFVSIGLVAIVILSFRARKRTPLAPG